MRYLNEEEIKTLKTREALQEALDFYEKHDRWIRVPADTVKAFGVTDYPLFSGELKERLKETCPEECFDRCVADAGIFLTIPVKEENEYKTFATRYTSLESVYERSGSNCRMVRTTNSHGAIKALPAERRGELINLGYTTSKEEILFLISDEMISYNGSRMYVILPYEEGVKAVEEVVSQVGDLRYKTGFISHEYLVAEWYVENGDTEAHKLFLKDHKIVTDTDDVKYILRFSSSNIGNSRMAARMFCTVNGCALPIGLPQSVWHTTNKAVDSVNKLNKDNGASVEHFKHKLQWIGASIKENEDLIEELGNTVIDMPQECVKNLLKKFCQTLPAKVKDEAVESCSLLPGCTAIDVYFAISDLQEKVDQRSMNKIVQITEEIAQLQFINFKAYDKEM